MLLYTCRNITALLSVVIIILHIYGCKRIIDIDAPVNTVNEENVYKTDATAIAVLNGVYANMVGNGSGSIFTGLNGISFLAGLSADELTLYSGISDTRLNAYYKNSLSAASPLNNYGSEFWASSGMPGLYYYVFICNAAIEGLNRSNALTPEIKKQLLGEAKFLRAFFYFYLVNLYGDAPLALSTDPAVNAVLPRAAEQQVYQQMIADLEDAINLLSSTYLDGNLESYNTNPERVRPTKWAATSLLARIYLYTGDYDNAEMQASVVINQTSLFNLTALNNAFLKNGSEAIWQIQPVAINRNTEDAFKFILPASGPNGGVNPVFLSDQLLNSFEAGDLRKKNWIDSVKPTPPGTTTYHFPYKYKATTTSGSATEYLMIIRLAEQYLIRAEARAQQNNFSGARTDLNIIRTRAGLPNSTANDITSLLAAILHERQVELFTEFGHRWLDLKRTNNADIVMNNVAHLKGGTWKTTKQLYPIPIADIQKNPNLIQNSGY